ncbi:MAG: amidohydrolase [Thermoplasmata archaeon]|nr:amidohydrolase [Thermoplasmata archaeon]
MRLTRSATLVIRNGKIYTVNSELKWAQAVVIDGDKIVQVGSDEDAGAFIGNDTRVVDAGGRLVLPGFNDSHMHISMAYEEAFLARLGSAKSFDEVVDIAREHGEAHPEYRMVGGTGWVYDAVLSGRRYPHKDDLDRIFSDRPVLLISYDGWVGLGNTVFTEMAEDAFKGRDQSLGGRERDPESGEATGVFHNPGDLLYLAGDLSALIRESELDGLRWVFGELPRYGITSFHDAGVDFRSIDAYERVKSEGGLRARAYVALGYHKSTTDDDLKRFAEIRAKHSDEWLRTGVVKLFIDGVLDSHTAAMLEPYADDQSSSGETKYTPEEYKDIIQKLDRMGFQCMTHSCGDRGVRVTLDAYEHATKANGRRDSRHRIEHIEMISENDIPRFKDLGVIASMQPAHAVPESDSVYTRAAGPKRMKTSFPWRSMDEAGAVLSFSSDWSVVDMDPLPGLQAAVTRNWSSGSPRTVSLEKAIEAYTLNGAYASFEDDIKGSIEVGKLADLVVLSDNLFEMPPEKIGDAEVLLTIVGGNETFRADVFKG